MPRIKLFIKGTVSIIPCLERFVDYLFITQKACPSFRVKSCACLLSIHVELITFPRPGLTFRCSCLTFLVKTIP
jgi:hypothetical protein